ncbi:MAG: hypothetical protein JW808_04760 [Victivallales bacterium]|nr:hypothetical protein [Victivallales bacterium]
MPDALEKLKILSEDSQYDLACACGTSKDGHRKRADGGRWLYPVPLASGGRGYMFKTLLTNCCTSDCRYCPLRSNANARRCTLTPDEAAKLFIEHLARQSLIGIFLTSGLAGNADHTMESLVAAASLLRKKYHYRGYVHLKVIPGASEAAIDEALRLSSAVSLNIEVPGARHFRNLTACKDFERDIVRPLKYIAEATGKGAPHASVKCSTQFVVGASDETDREIVRYMEGIYNRLNFQRVYFSAYQPGLGERSIPGEKGFSLSGDDRLNREHRLYQVDFLLRKYHFDPSELVYGEEGNLSLDTDPKQTWAASHPEFFPVHVNRADKESLLLVPGIGPVSVAKILSARKNHQIQRLPAIGIHGKLAAKASKYLDFS